MKKSNQSGGAGKALVDLSLEKFAASSRADFRFAPLNALLLVAIVTMSAITLGMGNLVTGMSLPVHGILAANSGLVLIGLLHGALALAVGAGTGSYEPPASAPGPSSASWPWRWWPTRPSPPSARSSCR